MSARLTAEELDALIRLDAPLNPAGQRFVISTNVEQLARRAVAEIRTLRPLLAAWRAQVEADIADGFAPSAADQALLEAIKS